MRPNDNKIVKSLMNNIHKNAFLELNNSNDINFVDSICIFFSDYYEANGTDQDIKINNDYLIYTCILHYKLRILVIFKEETKDNIIKFFEDEILFYNLITFKDSIVVCLNKSEHNVILILDKDFNLINQRFISNDQFLCYINNDLIFNITIDDKSHKICTLNWDLNDNNQFQLTSDFNFNDKISLDIGDIIFKNNIIYWIKEDFLCISVIGNNNMVAQTSYFHEKGCAKIFDSNEKDIFIIICEKETELILKYYNHNTYLKTKIIRNLPSKNESTVKYFWSSKCQLSNGHLIYLDKNEMKIYIL